MIESGETLIKIVMHCRPTVEILLVRKPEKYATSVSKLNTVSLKTERESKE